MSEVYVVYNIDTTRLVVRKRNVYLNTFKSKGAATRARNQQTNPEEYAITDSVNFFANVEKMVTRRNSMTGKDFQERINTPYSCSPASEAYWCS